MTAFLAFFTRRKKSLAMTKHKNDEPKTKKFTKKTKKPKKFTQNLSFFAKMLFETFLQGEKMATFDDVKAVVVEQLSVDADSVKLESKIIEDLGADSLDVVELIMALEEKFDIEIPDTDAEKLIKIEDVVKYIENLPKK